MAFITREQGSRAAAADVLGRLPGTGRYRDIALAAYGGLAMDNEDYELAARIWLTLQNQDYWTSATAAARLGFPVSLENLASREMALVQYRAAEQSFEHRLAALNELSGQAEDNAWVRGLLLAFSAPDEDPDQMGDLMVRWREELGHNNWLEWLSSEHVHNVLLEWRELLDMKAWLGRLPNVIEAFDEVTQEQRRRGMAARSLLHDQELLVKRDQLNARLDEVGGRLVALRGADAVPEAEWMLMLAKPDERELIVQLNSIQALIDKGMTAAEQRRWIPRVERLRGVLFWRLVDESSTRLRELDKSLIDIQQVVRDVDARIERAQSAEDQFVAGVATDYLLFTDRAQVITSQVDRALDNREQELANELRRGMQREMREVEQYLLITRIAIARATDQLAEARVDAPTGDGE